MHNSNNTELNDTDDDYFRFQIYDWNSYHEIDGDEEEKYVIQLFGRTMEDKDVCLKVTDFTPFFYVEIPLSWTNAHVDKFIHALKNKVAWRTNNNPNYYYDLSTSLIRYSLVKKHKFYNFSKKDLFKFVMLVFKNHVAMREFSNTLMKPLKILGLTAKPLTYQRYESNIEPHIRFMHINNLTSCGWVSINKSKLVKNKKYSDCDCSYFVNWKEVKPFNNDSQTVPFKLMGYDIECISCDHNFPQANRKSDKIIQIGMTIYQYGSMKCSEQHILTMKKCEQIKTASVECYKTEKGLIRGWAKKVSSLRPDFKAGYNNFGFDDKYIFDRIMRIDRSKALLQGINVEILENKFIDEILQILGKVNNNYIVKTEQIDRTMKHGSTDMTKDCCIGPSLTYFKVKNLSSSALGDNELKFFQIPGIISVDMMKIIQRDHRLVSYKLDNVSANFITEGVIKFIEDGEPDENNKIGIKIFTKSTKALENKSYIQIMIDDGYSPSSLNEGAKYKVLDIETANEKKINNDGKEEILTYQTIKIIIDLKDVIDLKKNLSNQLVKVYWTFAKDDMHHTLINKYFMEGDPKRIKQIAKYCLKDCKLVNLLLAKLEIIINSMGMANVCHVPLSYLFLRGQGVKIFSLVSKKCREKNFLIPVLRKKNINPNEEETETYEGATVITPKPGVYLSPIGVLDYSSLYPNSMREKNLSHECFVRNPKYDNLPGYIYHNICIIVKDNKGNIVKNIDGTPQKKYYRFAQELITDEQIDIELKNIIGKINTEMEDNIMKINQQTYYTDDNRKVIIDNEKIKNRADNESSNERKPKLTDKGKENNNTIIRKLIEQEAKIEREKKKLNDKIKEINDVNESTNKHKSKLIIKEKNKFDLILDEIIREVKLSDKKKEELICFEKEKANKKIIDEKAKKYNIVNGQVVKYGIVPEILTELLNKRKETNNRLAQEKDHLVKAILNSLQLAFKITANSLYGQTGAPTSPIFFTAIAASTTATGRERLFFAKKIVEENFEKSEVIYGDSVTGDTPIIFRDEFGDIDITTIGALGEVWKPYDMFKHYDSNRKYKQQANNNFQVWTANGWAKIKRVIRHKIIKKIYRILTPTGCIDVTEDHSLLDKHNKIITPTDCIIGTELLHGFMESNNIHDNISEEEAFILGSFMKNGIVDSSKNIWILQNDSLSILKHYHEILTNTENIQFTIIESSQINNEYILQPAQINEQLMNKYELLFMKGDTKAVPKIILNASIKIKNSFWKGYIKNSSEGTCIIENKITTQSIFYLLKCLKYNVVINIISNKYQTYELIYSKEEHMVNPIVVKKNKFIKFTGDDELSEYVYDLETESGTFHAGIGELIIKNTDSIFINFHIKDENSEELTDINALIKTIELCQQATKLINSSLPKPQSIVYEKTMHPFILVAKKKYVGLLFEKDPAKYYLKSMGIVLKRRDNAPIVKNVVGGIIDYILKYRDIDRAFEFVKQILRKIMDGRYPMDKFIISKTLKSRYKKPSTIAHKVLADRMAIRDPGNKPQISDRIPYVFIIKDMGKKKKKDILQGDLVEHPDYVIQNKLKIDYLYYLEHQIINPTAQLLELMISKKKVDKLFRKFIIEEDNKRKGRQNMEKWMDSSEIKQIKQNYAGSKTPKKQQKKSLKKVEKPMDKYDNLPFINKTKKHECQNMHKWLNIIPAEPADDSDDLSVE